MDDDPLYMPPVRVWLVSPKNDADFYAVYTDEAAARERVEGSAAGARMAGPYLLAYESDHSGGDE